MEQIKFFDCNVELGMRAVIHPGSFYKTGDLLKKMEHNGITDALVYHTLAASYRPCDGNEILMKEIENIPNLHPAWVIMPHHTGEFPEPYVLYDSMKKNNVRAVRMFPSAQGYSMSEWNAGGLLSMLEECGVPLLIHQSDISWDTINTMLTNHPKLKFILSLVIFTCGRNIYPLLNKHKNLFIETIGFKIYEGIEDVCKKFGAERLIFGSGTPLYSGGGAVGMIMYADITEREKRMIASGNLISLTEGAVL